MTAKKPVVLLLTALLLTCCTWFSCKTGETLHWYKGNLHTHTNLSDGDTPPEGVIRWYDENGYDFLSITDHNLRTPPDEYRHVVSGSLILIPGNEISDSYEDIPVHILALGLQSDNLKPQGGGSVLETLQNNITAIRQAGAVPVMAHPNYAWAFGAEEMTGVKGCFIFEVLNAHPAVNNAGKEGKPSTEEMWDLVLSAGKVLYGIGTDDTHAMATFPGKSWVMVKAARLSEKAILDGLEKGDFYVSTGVELDMLRVSEKGIELRIKAGTDIEYITRFIGDQGKVLKEDSSTQPQYTFTGQEIYVRARVTDNRGRLALTQPVFVSR